MGIEENKIEFINLISSFNRTNYNPEYLISKLENSDFFIAPASAKYKYAYAGGLCQHVLDVYHVMINMQSAFDCYKNISADSIIITALFHDFYKMNYYNKTTRNKKLYYESGSKKDSGGNYDWVTEESYNINENHFIYGSNESTSEYMTRTFIPLYLDESIAILHAQGGKGYDSAQDNILEIYKKYPLAFLLHTADTMTMCIDATMKLDIDESEDSVNE